MIRRLFCLIGWHTWKASFEDYIEQFGHIPIDGRIADSSVCEFCGKAYKDKR